MSVQMFRALDNASTLCSTHRLPSHNEPVATSRTPPQQCQQTSLPQFQAVLSGISDPNIIATTNEANNPHAS
jgi:hypothetical protein